MVFTYIHCDSRLNIVVEGECILLCFECVLEPVSILRVLVLVLIDWRPSNKGHTDATHSIIGRDNFNNSPRHSISYSQTQTQKMRLRLLLNHP
jgi:hypothetical protein